MVLPDPINHHACWQRVVRFGQPVSQLKPAAPLGDRYVLIAHQDFWETARDDFAKFFVVAPNEDVRILKTFVPSPLWSAILARDCLRDFKRTFVLQCG